MKRAWCVPLGLVLIAGQAQADDVYMHMALDLPGVPFNQIDQRDQTNQIDQNYLGNLSANPFDYDSTANQFGKGSPFAPNGINNPFSPYGSPFSNKSATNPFATDAPRLYDQQGHYRGKLSANPFDPDSTANPFGRLARRFRQMP